MQCEEVYTDMEETKEDKENRIEYFWKKEGNQQFTEDGRNAEITVDVVLQARAKVSENKVNGPEDAIVSEMIKRLPMEKIYTITGCPKTFHGHDGVSKLVEGIRSYRAIALTSVMSKWYESCILLRLEREKEPENGRSCILVDWMG